MATNEERIEALEKEVVKVWNVMQNGGLNDISSDLNAARNDEYIIWSNP